MKNKTGKKVAKSSARITGVKKTKIVSKKIIKKTSKISTLKVVPKSSPRRSTSKSQSGSIMRMKKGSANKSFGKVKKIDSNLGGGKGSLKISSEFAITVFLLVAGIFGYVLWMSNSDYFFAYENSSKAPIIKKKGQVKATDEPVERWKLFRSDGMGNEFRLPQTWKFMESEGKFVSEDGSEEIVVLPENESKASTAEELLVEAKKQDENANVQLISGQNGIKIEKREGETLKQIAKMFLGKGIVTVTYSSYGSEGTDVFFEKIVPTFKAL